MFSNRIDDYKYCKKSTEPLAFVERKNRARMKIVFEERENCPRSTIVYLLTIKKITQIIYYLKNFSQYAFNY